MAEIITDAITISNNYLILNKKYSYSVNLVLILYSNLGIRENTGKCAVAVRSLTNLLFDHFLGLLAFGIGCVFSALGGVLLMPFSSVYPTVGVPFTLIAFIVVVLGGLGSMAGTFLAGLFIGVVEAVGGTYVSPALKEAIYFGIFIIAIMIRPQGIFGKGKGTEEVGLK